MKSGADCPTDVPTGAARATGASCGSAAGTLAAGVSLLDVSVTWFVVVDEFCASCGDAARREVKLQAITAMTATRTTPTRTISQRPVLALETCFPVFFLVAFFFSVISPLFIRDISLYIY
ncbi:MAG TPA: hypothetical protein ENL23_06580 [Candidatus Acetothermia bacterium]|nr:hypothetical protein [Candidatus Acetothermia bacterium]